MWGKVGDIESWDLKVMLDLTGYCKEIDFNSKCSGKQGNSAMI